MSFQAIALALSAVSAVGQMEAGNRAKEAYDIRARNEELRGRVEAVNAKKKGVEALKRTNASLASILAGSPKQGLGYAGTVLDRGVFLVGRPASEDVSDTMFNASMAIANSQMRADDFRRAGDQARLQGQIGAIGTLAGGFGSYSSIGSPDGMTISKGLKQIGNFFS